MHFLAKCEIAHTTDFTPLIELASLLGLFILVGQNMKYTSECFMQETVLALAETVIEPIKEGMQASPYFSLLINETPDVSILKQVVATYVRKTPRPDFL